MIRTKEQRLKDLKSLSRDLSNVDVMKLAAKLELKYQQLYSKYAEQQELILMKQGKAGEIKRKLQRLDSQFDCSALE